MNDQDKERKGKKRGRELIVDKWIFFSPRRSWLGVAMACMGTGRARQGKGKGQDEVVKMVRTGIKAACTPATENRTG